MESNFDFEEFGEFVVPEPIESVKQREYIHSSTLN